MRPLVGRVAQRTLRARRLDQGAGWTIDLDSARLHVRSAYGPKDKVMTTVKSDASLRTVNLAGVLVEHLRAHRARHSGSDDALVFARGSLADAQRGHRGPQDAPFSDHTVGERARRVWARAGIELVESVTLHVARHSYGSMLAAGGVSDPLISKAMGHASVDIARGVYLHLRPDAAPLLRCCSISTSATTVPRQRGHLSPWWPCLPGSADGPRPRPCLRRSNADWTRTAGRHAHRRSHTRT